MKAKLFIIVRWVAVGLVRRGDEMQYIFSLINDLLDKPTNLSTASKYTAMNGLIYLAGGVPEFWPTKAVGPGITL
jgi:hypothetical protein